MIEYISNMGALELIAASCLVLILYILILILPKEKSK